eukprot:839184-Pyramimonas_sp.AAC.1
MLTSNSIRNAEHGHGGLTISASALTSVWQGCGVLTSSVCPSHERAASREVSWTERPRTFLALAICSHEPREFSRQSCAKIYK